MAGRLRPTGGRTANGGRPTRDRTGEIRTGGFRTGDGGAPDTRAGDPAEQAREICLRLLAARPRTRAELATALRRRRIADEVATEVLDRYCEVGMVDDLAFARAWVTSRHHGRGLARRALATELRRKGIDPQAVGAALDEVDDATEAQTARTLVERGLRAEPGSAPQVTLRRLVGMLARRGYSPGLAVRVVKQVLTERAGATDAADLASAIDGLAGDALEAAEE